MTTLKVKFPEFVSRLPHTERDILLSRITAVCASERVKTIESDLKPINEELKRFEKMYGLSFEEFEKKMPKGPDLHLHEDYIDWFFLTQVYKEKVKILDAYLGKGAGIEKSKSRSAKQ